MIYWYYLSAMALQILFQRIGPIGPGFCAFTTQETNAMNLISKEIELNVKPPSYC